METYDLDAAVLAYLGGCRRGTSEAVLARALDVSDYDVGSALDRLDAAGLVRLVRRTRTSETYGLTDAGRAAVVSSRRHVRAWGELMAWSEFFDGARDTSDEARRWSGLEASAVAAPDSVGARRAELEAAFEAGRFYERSLRCGGSPGGVGGEGEG